MQLFKACRLINYARCKELNLLLRRQYPLNILNNSIRFITNYSNGSQANDKKKFAARFVELSPKHIQPYMKLMRWDKPVGSWLLFWPCSWGIASAATAGCLPDPYMLTLFGIGAFIMRGAGCTINDMWDRDIDGKVIRTKDRPLVNGDISMRQSWLFLACQLSLGLAVLLQLNWYSVFLGASSMGLVITYPLMKRFTYWPQLGLGFTFNWGVLLGYSAINGSINWSVCLPLYVAGITWTIVYDTIYAHQDKNDDRLLGIKSTAIKFDRNTKYYLTGFASTMTSCLILSGIYNELSWPYYISIGFVASHLANQILSLNIDNPKDCNEKFISNIQIGFIIFIGILFGNLFKNRQLKERKYEFA